MRKSRQNLDAIVTKINTVTKGQHEFYLDSMSTGLRLTTKKGRDVSPRLKPKAMEEWLEAYHAGLVCAIYNTP